MGGSLSNTRGLVREFTAGPHALKPRGEHPAVVRRDVGVPVVALLTQETIQYVFNPELVDKERLYLGYIGVPDDLLRGHCPSMFTNGQEHRQKKAFLIDVFSGWQKSLPSILLKEILAHFEEWSRLEAVSDFEDRVFFVVAEALTEAVLGEKVDGRLALTWLQGLLTKVRTWLPMTTLAKRHRLASEALPKLLKSIEEAPKYKDLIQLCRTHGIDEEDGITNVMYTLLFNAAPAVRSVVVTFIARLHTVSESEKNDLLQTTLQTLVKHKNVSEECLGEMKFLESVLLEVLRLHPTIFNFFGIAKKDFAISLESETVEVRKGEQLMGSAFWAQRDVTVFPEPDAFRCRRFMDEEGSGGHRKHLVFPHGSLTDEVTLGSHQCPGQGVALFMMKATLAVFLSYCSWELTEPPQWSDKPIRTGRPDKLVSLARFDFNSDEARRVFGM